MSAYHLLEILLVSLAVGFSAYRVWKRYIRSRPAVASVGAAAPAATSCGGCGSGSACEKSKGLS